MRGDLEAFQQLAIIQALTARPHDEGTAQRINPDLAGMGSQQHAIIGIAKAIGQNWLFGRLDPVQRRANRFHMHKPAAGEAREIKHHSLYLIILHCGIQGPHQIPRAVLVGRHAAAEQCSEPARLFRLFNHRAIKFEQ